MGNAEDLEAAIGAGIARGGIERDVPGPYLVYADWLQERGDPRGDLIVVQHALELEDTPELRAEERALIDTNLTTWLGGAFAHHAAGELELVWRRGFVWEARIRKFHRASPDDPVAILRALAALAVARLAWRISIEVASFAVAWSDIAADCVAALPATVVNLDRGRPSTAPAVLVIEAIPAAGYVENRSIGARIEPAHDQPFTIGIVPEADLVCRAPGLGGRRNSVIRHVDGRWHYDHLRHSLPIMVNGREIESIILCDGDRIAPASGLVFCFDVAPGT